MCVLTANMECKEYMAEYCNEADDTPANTAWESSPHNTNAFSIMQMPYACSRSAGRRLLLLSYSGCCLLWLQVGFGNARAVRVYFDQVRARQAQRVTLQRAQGADPDIFVLTQEDLLGHNHTEVQLRSSEAYKALAAMEGLAPVKESVDQLVKHVVHNAEREMQEKPVLGVALNRVFLGAHPLQPARIVVNTFTSFFLGFPLFRCFERVWDRETCFFATQCGYTGYLPVRQVIA